MKGILLVPGLPEPTVRHTLRPESRDFLACGAVWESGSLQRYQKWQSESFGIQYDGRCHPAGTYNIQTLKAIFRDVAWLLVPESCGFTEVGKASGQTRIQFRELH